MDFPPSQNPITTCPLQNQKQRTIASGMQICQAKYNTTVVTDFEETVVKQNLPQSQ